MEAGYSGLSVCYLCCAPGAGSVPGELNSFFLVGTNHYISSSIYYRLNAPVIRGLRLGWLNYVYGHAALQVKRVCFALGMSLRT